MEELNTAKNWRYIKEEYADSGFLNHQEIHNIFDRLRNENVVYFVDNKEYIKDRELEDEWYIKKIVKFYEDSAAYKSANKKLSYPERRPIRFAIISSAIAVIIEWVLLKYILQ